jgi:dTDP-glucose 4,6-dehydratase
MNSKRCVLVIGSNSFTGSHFVNYVLDKTDANVVGISRSSEYNSVFLPYRYRKAVSGRFHFEQIDINRDFDEFIRLCEVVCPEIVVNYAAQGEVRNSWRWPEQWYETNCLGVVRVAEFLKDREYLKKYVAVSTPEVYGTTGEQIKEGHTYHPSTPYAASKLAGDLHLLVLHKRYGFPVVFTRAANLYGIHQQLYRIIPRATIYMKLGRKLELHGRGQAERAFIHARDVADLTWRAIEKGKNGETYHLAPDDGLRNIASIVRTICNRMNVPFEKAVDLVDENYGQDARFSMDNGKVKRELGWTQRVQFEDGVDETIRWIEENWTFLRQQPLDYFHKE